MVQSLVHSGIPGLDAALGGGFPEKSMVVVEGEPGTGKTTMGLQFICAGALEYHEPGVYVSFEELPEQIYANAIQFTDHLKQLEESGVVRIVGCSPSLFVDQIQGIDGTLRSIIEEIGAKRLVVDSVNLLNFGHDENFRRDAYYSLLQALRHLSLTVLLIRERTQISEYVPIDHFVCDGIIRLAIRETEDTFTKRTLRVAKLRKNAFDEREFVFRISSHGMYVVSPMGFVDRSKGSTVECQNYLHTVFSKMFSTGTITLFDVSSVVNPLPLQRAIISHRMTEQDAGFIWSLSASMTIHDFLNIAPEVRRMFLDGRLHFIEHFQRPADYRNHPNVINAVDINKEEYRELLLRKLVVPVKGSLSRGEQWFLCYDLNDVHNLRGTDFILSIFPEVIAYEKTLGLTTVIFTNLNEISLNLRAMLERTSDNVVRIWVEKGYEYLQVVKSKEACHVHPLIVETLPLLTDIRLV